MAAPMLTNTLIVKIHNGTDIRRFTTQTENLNWHSLLKRVSEAFETTSHSFKLTYVDDENDRITLTCEAELAEAIDLARRVEPPVLRLTVIPKDAPKNAPKDASKYAPDAGKAVQTEAPAGSCPGNGPAPPSAPPELATFMNTLMQQLPAAMDALPDELRKFLPRAELDIAATVAANAQVAANADSYCGVQPHGANARPGVHVGVSCDKTGMSPIVGNRYHLVGHNYDLCEAEYAKLADKEKALFRKIEPPAVPSDKPNGKPNDKPNDKPLGLHPGVECDKSGMNPIVGMRYHLRGHNYDLCSAEFDQLPAEQKALYDAIPPPVPAAAAPDAAGMGTGAMCGAQGPWRPSWRARCGMAPPGGWHPHEGNALKLAARFVRDVTIFDGTQMPAGTAFTKIWRLKNVGEVPWPAGTKMLFVGGDQMTTEMSVPLSRESPVFPGDEVDVAVEMQAPTELGRYLGYWRLTGPHGRRKFGQRVWCHIQVVDPSQPPAAFEDLQTTLAEIESKKTALAATETDADADADAPPPETAVLPSPPPPPPPVADVDMSAPMPVPAAVAAAAASVQTAAPSAADVAKDGDMSDDGVLVTDGMLVDAGAPCASGSSPPAPLDTKGALAAMGFTDQALLEAAIAKNGDDLEACARDLAAAAEWDALLDDLSEMGFGDRDLNKSLMLKNSGNIKRTVKDLVEA